jgi:hypothetical protein
MKNFSEWLLLRENDDDSGLDLSLDLDTDTSDVPSARPQARPVQPQARPAQPTSAQPKPTSQEIVLGGKGSPYKFLGDAGSGSRREMQSVKSKLYDLITVYIAPENDKIFSGLVGLKNHPVKVRLSLDDVSVSHDKSLETLLAGGVKGIAHAFSSVKKFGELEGRLSVISSRGRGGIEITLKIMNIDFGDKGLYPRLDLLKKYFWDQGQIKRQWADVTVRVKI